MFPRLDGGQSRFRVQIIWRRNVNNIYRWILNQFAPIAVSLFKAQPSTRLLCQHVVLVRDRVQNGSARQISV
jgi:hypothetical protein